MSTIENFDDRYAFTVTSRSDMRELQGAPLPGDICLIDHSALGERDPEGQKELGLLANVLWRGSGALVTPGETSMLGKLDTIRAEAEGLELPEDPSPLINNLSRLVERARSKRVREMILSLAPLVMGRSDLWLRLADRDIPEAAADGELVSKVVRLRHMSAVQLSDGSWAPLPEVEGRDGQWMRMPERQATLYVAYEKGTA
jgi:hypothetical protein